MAVWSIVKLSALYGEGRLDAECYRPAILRDEHALEAFKTVRLGDVATVTDGQHGYHEVDPDSPVRHITAKCVLQGRVDGDDVDRLAKSTHDANTRSQLAVDDILLSTAGRIGEAGLVCADILPANIDQDVARITLNANAPIAADFLVAFLNSEFGRFQSERSTTGQIQCHISLATLRDFRIPVVTWQDKAGRILRDSINHTHTAKALQSEAEEILTAALGLDRMDLAPHLTYEDTYARVADAARMDAEYFSPRTQNLIETLSVDGRSIGDVAPPAKWRFTPVPGKSFDYIQIADISTFGTAGSSTIPGEEAPSRATWIVRPGDIITTTVRPIRRLSAIIPLEQDGFVCSSGLAVLRPRDIAPELLLTYLRLPLIVELLDLHTTASMYPAISTADLLGMPFRLPDAQARVKIVAKVRESLAARADSLRLLAEAKCTVENAITANADTEQSTPKG
jgi:hypothetical protein